MNWIIILLIVIILSSILNIINMMRVSGYKYENVMLNSINRDFSYLNDNYEKEIIRLREKIKELEKGKQ